LLILAREVGLDMTGYWQATAVSYLGRVGKDRILDALREGGTSDVEVIARLKKPAMAAAAAEAALLGKGWLPQLLRALVLFGRARQAGAPNWGQVCRCAP
jgi:ParB family transcriptional regulator, chromosome partitioning protein